MWTLCLPLSLSLSLSLPLTVSYKYILRSESILFAKSSVHWVEEKNCGEWNEKKRKEYEYNHSTRWQFVYFTLRLSFSFSPSFSSHCMQVAASLLVTLFTGSVTNGYHKLSCLLLCYRYCCMCLWVSVFVCRSICRSFTSWISDSSEGEKKAKLK